MARTTPKKAAADTPSKGATPASQWKNNKTIELTVPSGNVCLVRRPPGIQSYLVNGSIPNALMPMITAALDGDNDGEINLKDIASDPAKLQAVFSLADRLVLDTVIEPHVMPLPDPGTDRDDDCLYIDEIDLDDKMFIMSYAMAGVKDLESFRSGQAQRMASLEVGDGVPSTAS